jgi:iron complex transport system substrate-binding protein
MKNPKYLVLIIICALLTALLAGAWAPISLVQTESAETIELTDGLGRMVTIELPIERVISLAPSNTEIIYAVGAGDLLVGRDAFSDYPEAVLEVSDIGGGWGELDIETILTLEADLVLASGLTAPEQIQSLEDLGITVFAVPNPTDLKAMFDNLQTVALITGNEAQTENLVADLRARVAVVEEKVAGIEERPSIFYELDSTDPNAPWTSGPGTFMDTMINMAGGSNIGAVLEGAWAQINLEELIVQDPDIILLGTWLYGGITPENVAERAGWETLTAVQEGRVYAFDDNLVGRPGPRLVDGLEALAEFLHPELFANNAAVERIVSLSPSNTEILFAVGAGDLVVGVTEYCNFPKAALGIDKIGGFSAKSISIETIVSLKPDLVLAYSTRQEPIVEALEALDIEVITLAPTTLEDIYANISMLGELTGNEDQAQAVVADMRMRVQAVVDITSAIPQEEKTRVFWEVFDEPLMTSGPATFIGQMLDLAGAVNIFADLDEEYPQINAEEVVSRNPQAIMGSDTHGDKLTADQVAARPGWNQIDAAQNGRIYLISGDIVSRAGPRLADAVEAIALALYPDLFE